MSRFKSGDVCVVVNSIGACPEESGTTVTVSALVHVQSDGTEFYTVDELSPHWFAHYELRLIPPSTDDFTAGDWGLCPWKPKHLERA